MTDEDIHQDTATIALDHLANAADEGVAELQELQRDLRNMREHRLRGWSWRQVMSTASVPKPLVRMARIASDLGAAGGSFRRALAQTLRSEGMQVSAIADLFDVSRQRVSTLIRTDSGSTNTEP